jgi:hypothetical protein
VAHGAVADVDDGRDLADAQFPPGGDEKADDGVPGFGAERLEGGSIPRGVRREVRDVTFERFDARLDVGGSAFALPVGDQPLEPLRLLSHE